MKQILLLASCLFAFWGCTKGPDAACLPPPPTPIYIVLSDSMGHDLLDSPARYPPDSIRILFAASPFSSTATPVPATEGTVDSERALVLYYQSSSCRTSPFWSYALIQFDPIDTDTLTVDDPQASLGTCHYNGQPIASNGYPGPVRIRVRK